MSNFKLTPIEEDSSASFRLTPVESPSRSVADIVGDIGVTALKGAISLPEAFVGLADIPTGGSVGKALAEAGYRPDEAKKTLDTLYSDAQQEANRKVQSADGFVETLKTAVDNPSTIATAVGESLPSMIGGAGIARGILKAAPKVAPFIAGAAGEGIIGAGSAAESIRNETSDKLLTPVQSASAVASGVGTGALGAVGGKVAAKLGVADVDTMLAKGAGQASKAGFMRQVVGSGISEGAFEELPQSMQEQMWQNFATGKPIGEGVGNAGAMGLLSGAAMGGAGGGYNAFTGKNVPPDNPATPPAAEPEKTPDIQTAMAKADGFIRLGELDSIAEDRPLNAAEQGEYQTLLTKLNEEDHGQDATTADAQMDSPSVEGGRIELPGSGNVLVPVSDSDAGNPDVSAGVAETGMREAAPVGAPGAPSLTTRAQPTTTRVLDQQPAELTLPKLSPVHADKVSSIDTRINEIAQDLPTRSKAVQKSLQREAEALAKEKEGVIAQAHADEGADPELMAQYNAAKTAGNHDEMRRLAHEINGQKRKKAPEAKPAERAEGLTLGTAPNAADPVSVRNGVVYVGNYPAQDFDSGEDVRVSADATPFQIRDALTKAGAIGRGQKMFGLPAETKAPKQSKQDRKKLDASKDSLFMAIAKLGGMDTQELLTNGFDRNDITQETAGRVSKKGKNAGKLGKKSRKPIAMGFAMPLHKNGGMSFDGMLEALKQHGYFGEDATKNDAIDAFRAELGGEKYLTPDAQMQQADQDQAEYDAMMAAEQDRIDAENAAEEAAKEESGYDDLSDEAQEIADDFPDIDDIDNPAGAQSEEDAMRALGFTEEEINEQTRQSAEPGNESVAGEGGDAAEGSADSDRASRIQDGQGQREVPEGAKPGAGNEEGGKGGRAEVGDIEQGRVGMKLAAGQIVLTASGRQTTPFPKFQSGTGKMNKSHLAAVDAWLLENAKEEALSRGDKFNGQQFERDHYDAVNRKTVPQASKDAAEEYLFGEQPAVVPSILKSLVPDQNGGFVLAGQTPAEVKAQEAKRKAEEAKKDAEEKAPTVKFDQVDLFNTQGGLVNSNREAPKTEKKTETDKEGADLTWPEVLDEAWNNGFETGNESFVPTKQNLEKAYQRTLTDEQVAEYTATYQKGARESSERTEAKDLKKGDRFKDGQGKEFEVWNARTSLIEAFPVVDGKPQVSRDTGVRFATDDRARQANPEARTDVFPVEKAAPENVNTASWVIRDRATGAVIMETFDRKKVDALNLEKYEAIPIQKHLAGINKDIKAGEETKKTEPTQAPSAADNAKEDAAQQQRRENPNIQTGVFEHAETMERIREGTATLAEYKAAFERLLASQEEIKGEIGALTKDAIFKRFPGLAYRYKNEKKADIVKAAYRSMMDDFVLADSFQWSMGQKYESVIRGYVEKETDESLRQFAEKVKRNKEERQQAREDAKQAVADPKTLEDFGLYLRAKINGGMTEQEARLSLSPEQRAKYDDLFAAETRSVRSKRSESAKAEVRVAAQTTTGQVIETKHTKTGEPLFVVKAADRVERDVYSQWNAAAKKLGGWYSSFRGNGAVPGFQFKTRENADAFLSFLGGDVQPAQEMVKERRDAFTDDRSQSAVERLTEMADRLEEKADESLGRERKANTDRRARFAASAEAAANGEKALAKTMRNIAKAIESGSAKFLDRVRQKAQVEMLRSVLNTAQGEKIRAKYPTYLEQERHKGEAPNGETADYARWPSFTAFRSDLASLGRELSQIDGAKKIGKQLLAVADDVTDAYKKFAKENLHKVSVFSKKREGDEKGEMAMFGTADAAEDAIVRSGYKGKAISISFKRGQHLVIMGPEMAREAGHWQGDDDRRITLRPEAGEEIVSKVRELKGRKISMPWVFDSASTERARWKGMGIESAVEMRAALREFVSLREAPAEADKIKQMERAMIGRKNDGLDFFPTPAETAKALIDAAGIEEGMSVLEPSAGMGHIAEQIREAGVDPDVIEYSNDRRELLEAKGFRVVGNDFMEMSPRGFTFGDVFRDKDGTEGVMRGLGGLGSNRVRLVVDGDERAAEYVDRDDLTGVRKSGYNSGYDRIIMNPPFSDRRDAEHVQHAYSLLKPGGRLVAIMGEGVFYGQDKKAQAFREWLDEVGGTSEKLPEGTFLDPSLPVNTSVNARMVVVDKPEGGTAMFSRTGQNQQTVSPEFKRWFGDSRVVDAEGKPLVVYHGTTNEFSSFGTDTELGAHFGPVEQAELFAADLGARMIPVYLSIKNPIRLIDLGGFDGQYVAPQLRDMGLIDDQKLEELISSGFGQKASRDLQSIIRSAGYDGVVYLNRREGQDFFGPNGFSGDEIYDMTDEELLEEFPDAQDSWIAFEPTQIKSAIGNNGQFDSGNPDIRFARSDSWYYSNLARQIEAAPDKVFGPAKQVKAWLQSNAGKLGIKADEIQWTGINDWLDMQTGKVSKADVLAYLDANGVQVQEVVKGDKPRPDDYQEATFEEAKQAAEADKYVVNQWGGRIRQDRAHLMAPDDKYYVAKTEVSGPTKYATYVLPGGENYRELLLTLPVVQRIPTFEQWNESREFRGDTPGTKEQYDNDVGFYAKRGTYGDRSSQFRSSHWDEPNILAHIRYNDRIDADGNRVLFIEELQSDWGQKGKKEGFAKGFTVELNDGTQVPWRGEFNFATKDEAQKVVDFVAGPPSYMAAKIVPAKGTPAAPFVTDTKAWVALAVKRMIAHAAQNGYDKVAFVTGEQSAERYDLSKQISRVKYEDNSTGGVGLARMDGEPTTGMLYAYDLNNKEVIAERVEPSEVENYVGKDAAAKLFAAAPESGNSAGVGIRRRQIRGLDLKVGGEGMKTFYDTIVPQVVNDVLKKVGGVKVETVAMPRNGREGRSMSGQDVDRQRKEGTLTDQPGFTITPAMREKAGTGLPLFARRETSGQINLQDLDAVASSMSREFPGVPIITVEDERQLPKALREEIKKADASGDVSGVFHAGKIYLIQSNIKDIEDAQVRAVHEVVHAGLSAMGVSDETFLNIGVSNPKLHSEARKIKAKYGYSFVTSIEEAMADMGPAARKLSGWKRVIANVRDKLRKLGFVRKWSDSDVEFLVLRALRMMKQKDSAVVSNKAVYSSLSANHDDEGLAFAAEFVNELAIEDDAFRYAISKSKTLEGNLADALPGVEYLGEDTRPDEREESKADHRFVFAMPNEKIFYVYTKGKEVWIDVSRLLQGDEGSAVYHGVANYAYNTGKTFIGDPQGLSEDAVIRRTGAMLSSAVRFGTTSHLGASREQMNGDPAKGIEPLAWRGDDVAKTKALIHTYLKTLQNLYPEIIGSYYDFASGEFRDSTHRPLRWLRRDSGGDSNGQEVGSLGAGGSDLVSREARAGKTSVRRGILLQSLMASESSQRPELLGYILRRSTQLASKAGGPFNALFSRAGQGNGNGDNRAVAGGIPGNNGNAIPAETRVEAARRQGQDKFLRFKVVQDWLKAQGVNVSDLSNVYRAETLMHGRVSMRIEDFREKHLQPLIKRIQKAGFALTDIAEYLEAKHTPEANQKQREIHKDPEATAAGVSDADALATVQKWEASPKFAEFAAMADEVRSISDQTRDMLVKAGILSPEMAEAWQKAYQHYVPLKGGPVEPSAKMGAGPGLSVKAKQKRRLGHGQRDEFVIENIIAAHEKAIRQVEKNRVGRTLALLLNEANNEEVGTIGKPAKRQVLKETASYEVLYHGTVVEAFHNLQDARNFVTNESGRQNRSPSDFVVTKSTDPIVTMMASPMLAENEAVYYLHGKEVRLQLNDPYLARAYKNLGVEDLGKFLSIGRDINSWLSKAYTGYNPEFLLVNIVRDFTAGLANMTGDYGAGFALNVVKNYPAAMKAMWKSKDGNYTQLIKEYRDDGGSTGAAYLSDLERVGNNLQRAYDDARGMQATWKAGRKLGAGRVAVDKSIAWVMTYVEHLNRVGENAMRVALYQTLRESGKPRAEAAEAAKNVTVNFNRKGEVAAQAGAMYLFFNPNVQGTAKLLETMLKSPHKKQAWAMIGAMAGMAFMLANLGRGDDEDEWRNIPSHVKDRNMVLKFGDTQVTLPVPYGYGFFHMIGNAMSDLTHGVNAGKVAMNLTSGFFEHFSPVGNPFAGDEANSKNLVQLLPTLARIPGEIAVNRTGLGGPVMPEKSEWDKHKPDSQTMFRTTKGGFLAQTAEAMNDATGGTKYASGAVDVSPETLKYLIRTTTGGTGTFIGDSLGLAYRGAQGAVPELREIPIVRKFVREETIQDVRRRYYEATEEAKKATNELAAAKRNHDPDGARTIVEDKRELIAMGRVADKMRKSVAAQRDAQDRIMQDEELSLPEKRSRVKALENEEAHLYNRYLKLFQQKEEERSVRKADNQ